MLVDLSDSGQTLWERTASQVVRYEALLQLLDEMLVQDDILTVAKLAATKWKYFSNVASWHLVLANADGFLLIDGFHGTATLCHTAVLPPWDRHFWNNPRPIELLLADIEVGLSAPAHLTGKGVHQVLVLPIVSNQKCLGTISVATRHRPFSETDKRYVQMFSRQLTARINHLVLTKKLIDVLTSRATLDSLTGLLNRGSIMEQLSTKLAFSRRSAQPLAIIMADIDYFKQINDTYGHQVGDEALQETSRRMRQLSRNSDAIGRYGGEEFLFVLFPCTRQEVTCAAERLRESVFTSPFNLQAQGEHTVHVTLSAGCACTDGKTSISTDALLKQADDALYEAKANGRNRIVVAH